MNYAAARSCENRTTLSGSRLALPSNHDSPPDPDFARPHNQPKVKILAVDPTALRTPFTVRILRNKLSQSAERDRSKGLGKLKGMFLLEAKGRVIPSLRPMEIPCLQSPY